MPFGQGNTLIYINYIMRQQKKVKTLSRFGLSAELLYRRALGIDEAGLRGPTIPTSRSASTTLPYCCKPPTG